jgi:hypothetical protein
VRSKWSEGIEIVMLHEARQVPAWLIFDVSQKTMRATIKAATITGAFGLGGIVLGFILNRWASSESTARIIDQHREEIRRLENDHRRDLAIAHRELQLTRFRQMAKLISDSKMLVTESDGRTFQMTRSVMQKRFRVQQKIEFLLPYEELRVFLKENAIDDVIRTFSQISEIRAKLEFSLEQIIDSLPELGDKISQDAVILHQERLTRGTNEHANAQIRYWEYVGTLSTSDLKKI